MRKSTTFLITAMLLTTTLAANAQKPLPGIPPAKIEKVLKQGKSTAPSQIALMKKNYPLLFQRKSDVWGSSQVFKEKNTVATVRKPLNRKAAPALAGGATLPLWLNLMSQTASGIYSLTPAATMTPEQLAAYSKGYFNAGCGVVDNKLTGMYLDASMAGWGIIFVYNYAFDTDTWQLTGDPVAVDDYSLIALETAQDPQTGEVFGEFFSSDLRSYEWGVIDYESLTRTTIAPATHAMVALGIASDGSAYGIASDGNLYKIDRQTGAETLVGSTGLTLVDAEGAYYYQTGEINPKTDVFYWASTDKDGNSKLYTVDLSSGQLTAVGDYSADFPAFNAVGMVIPKPAAEDGAPAAVENAAVDFSGASKSGTLTFTAPTKCFDGTTALSGSLDYQVVVNRTDTIKGTTTPGANVTVPVTVKDDGVAIFAARVGNLVGMGPFARVTKYVGYDQPAAPGDVTLEVDEANKATVAWTAPTTTAHNGYLGALTYDVYRIAGKDTTQVATALTATTFSETLPQAALTNYVYGVVAKNSTQSSPMALSNGKVVGSALEVPFWDDFDSNIATYTVIDANNDKSTWAWDKDHSAARYRYNAENAGDDWLITPPIHLLAGKSYEVSFKARANGSYFPERIEAKWGNSNTVEGMANELAPATDLKSNAFVEFTKTITAPEEGTYYFGFHAISDANEFYLYLDSVAIDLAAESTAPDSVTNLKAAADATGALRATLTFTAPSKCVNGSALSSISKIEVRKGNDVVGTLTNVAPGKSCSFTDENAAQGVNSYMVMPYNESGHGLKNKVSVFVGVDVPGVPEVSAQDKLTSVRLTWPDVAGASGGLILPDKVTYSIYNVDDNGYLADSLGQVTGGNEFSVSCNTTEGDVQNMKFWAVMAANAAGKSSSGGTASVIVGRPYTLPFHNSFKGGTLEDQFVGIYRTTRAYSWGVVTDACDGDGGGLGFTSTMAASGYIFTGKISLAGALQPKLLLYYKSPANVPATFSVAVQHPDGTVDNPLFTTDLKNNTNTEWQRVMVDVPAALVNEPYVILQLQTTATEDMGGSVVNVDNINLFDPQAYDAGVEVAAPDKVNKGQGADINVTVTNEGLNDVAKPHLTLKVNDEVVRDTVIDKTLKTLENVKLSVPYRTTTLNSAESLTVTASLAIDDDNTDNNVATAVIQTIAANVAPPTDLKADGSAPVELTWKAPESAVSSLTDDFESYDPWSLTFGDWTTVDADQGKAGGISQNVTYDHQGEKFAFMNWQPSDYWQTGGAIDPHSGKKALVAIYQLDDSGQEFVGSDNWLISPRLSGNAQTIHFWVNNAQGDNYGTETFKVLASSTDNNTQSFTQIGEDYTQASGTWTEITVDLPAGSNYFAIHHVTSADNALIFMLDDFTYETSTAPVGYNVYRDDKLMATATTLNYTDATAKKGETYTYKVTAVYMDGSESAPISTTIATTISQLENSGATNFNVYTLDGVQVLKDAKSLKGLKEGVYIINGVKTILRK
ncbi:MAG: choice-of-anchor J domain-containing protein [Prevotella sp.]|nr:choice-of-anchor J domain-containing protein [Bacteroidales bacterium]MDY4229837.1 choice-of-anchor J domain-containing protein [Prevotella sp.]